MDNIITNTISLIEKNSFFNSKYSPIYMFSTENIKGVINSLNVSNKNVLTVSSSGDHIFNMLVDNANNIESFDINYLAKYYFYFKEAAIRTLTYNQFLDFFFLKRIGLNSKIFDDKIFFTKILPNIKDEEAQYFWKTLFQIYGGRVLYNSNLFIQNVYPKNTYIECNNYLSNEINYKKLQKRLNSYNYKFYNINIFDDISSLTNYNYDIIYLSNILDRLYCKTELEYVKKVKDIVIKLKQHLKTNGILSMCYLYLYQDDYWYNINTSRIMDPIFRMIYFDEECYYNYFNGINDINGRLIKNNDALMLTLNKKN